MTGKETHHVQVKWHLFWVHLPIALLIIFTNISKVKWILSYTELTV
jgi:hypothetical protein